MKKKKGFSLIELLVVISIIGLLSTLAVVSLNNARRNAQITKAQTELSQIVKAITIAQGETGQYLLTITGSGCSDCSGGRVVGFDYRNIPETDPFYARWALSISNIDTASNGLANGVKNITRDPWGSPYHLDENEGEGGGCAHDSLYSNGPDGFIGTADDIYSQTIPYIRCP